MAGSSEEMTNGSGWRPTGYRVLVRADKVETKTASGIIVATMEGLKKEEMAQIQGTLVAVGPTAFRERADVPPLEEVPIGSRVLYAKYGGLIVKGRDGEDYRMLNDLDLVAVEIPNG